MGGMFRAILFLVLITSAFASETLDALVDSASSFSAAIEGQLEATQSHPLPSDFAQKSIAYATAKITYFDALRAAMPELMDIATGRKPRPPRVDQLAKAFNLAGESQETVADDATSDLLRNLPDDPDIEKAQAEFEKAQQVEEQFHKDFDGQDFAWIPNEPLA
jgi:hypothetical protein